MLSLDRNLLSCGGLDRLSDAFHRQHSREVERQGMEDGYCLGFLNPAYSELLQSSVATYRIGEFGD